MQEYFIEFREKHNAFLLIGIGACDQRDTGVSLAVVAGQVRHACWDIKVLATLRGLDLFSLLKVAAQFRYSVCVESETSATFVISHIERGLLSS